VVVVGGVTAGGHQADAARRGNRVRPGRFGCGDRRRRLLILQRRSFRRDVMKRTVILATDPGGRSGGDPGVAAQRARPVIRDGARSNTGQGQPVPDPGRRADTTVFVTAGGVVLVDTNSPTTARPSSTRSGKVTDKPVSMIIHTHTHPDHNGSQRLLQGRRPPPWRSWRTRIRRSGWPPPRSNPR